jgi:hypothetical protein
MLSVNKYSRAYVDGCHSRVDAQLAAYKALVKAASANAGALQVGAALQVGDTIQLSQADFRRRSEAFFAEMESKYS